MAHVSDIQSQTGFVLYNNLQKSECSQHTIKHQQTQNGAKLTSSSAAISDSDVVGIIDMQKPFQIWCKELLRWTGQYQ